MTETTVIQDRPTTLCAPYFLRRHPFEVRAHFRHSLVLTYALPAKLLQTMLPPGLEVDRHDDCGFVAIAMVQTERLRPWFLPKALGQNFFLAGYRIFVTFRQDGRTRRGLFILRSDTDRRLMAAAGNLLTHYRYRISSVRVTETDSALNVRIRTKDGRADLEVTADLADAPLPAESVFVSTHDARRFAGPLPFTFDYEPQTHSIIAIKGVRQHWNPHSVAVDVRQCTFFDGPAWRGVRPILSNAFYVADIDYAWQRGVRHLLGGVQ